MSGIAERFRKISYRSVESEKHDKIEFAKKRPFVEHPAKRDVRLWWFFVNSVPQCGNDRAVNLVVRWNGDCYLAVAKPQYTANLNLHRSALAQDFA